MRISSSAAAVAVPILLASAISACHSLPPSKPAAEWTPQEARGAAVFQSACARCHFANTTSALHGPGLQALTRRREMPSGAPPTDARISAVIQHGRQMMPATNLSDQQLSDLLAYLHTL